MMQASDILLHSKDSDRTERVIFPITRYDNIIAAPRFLNLGMDIGDSHSAPFALLQTDTVSIDESELEALTKSRLILDF